MLNANLLDVHDIAYFDPPNPVALSRVTLRPWALEGRSTHQAFPRALSRAMDLLKEEVPNYVHGMVVHRVQLGPRERYRPASVSTLRQYASLYPSIGCVAFKCLLGDGLVDRVILIPTATHLPVPKWVWQHLAASIFYKTHTSGESPGSA